MVFGQEIHLRSFEFSSFSCLARAPDPLILKQDYTEGRLREDLTLIHLRKPP
jgi:hypothetical protein